MDNSQLNGQAATSAPIPQTAVENKGESLAAKQRKLQQAKDEAARLNQEVTAKQTEVKLRQVQFDELARSLDGYKKCSAESLQEQLDTARQLISQEGKQAAGAVKQKKSEIDAIIHRFGDGLQQKADNLEKAQEAVEAATETTRAAEAAAVAFQADYETIKKFPKATEQSLKEVTGLIDQAVKAEAQGEFAAMYFLIGQADALANTLMIPTADAFEAELIARRDEADKARAEATEAGAIAARAADAYLDAEKKHAAATTSFRGDVLKALKDMA
jgi:ElaB/YqjD/DUF883 family membrane-anchored ribosome-binding protein